MSRLRDRDFQETKEENMTSGSMTVEETRTGRLRRLIEEHYQECPTGGGASFGELLAYELHVSGITFRPLAKKWGISLPTLGELIHDHCKRLEEDPFGPHEPIVGPFHSKPS
jgi:hypothetical protein